MALAFSELFATLNSFVMAIDRGNETTTQLLTLLNVSATKAGKRKWILDDSRPSEKLNKRRSVQFEEASSSERDDAQPEGPTKEAAGEDATVEIPDDGEDAAGLEAETSEGASEYYQPPPDINRVVDSPNDPYESHFGPNSADMSEDKRKAADDKKWKMSRTQRGKLGAAVEYIPDAGSSTQEKRESKVAVRRNGSLESYEPF